jgi:hypothetical protein
MRNISDKSNYYAIDYVTRYFIGQFCVLLCYKLCHILMRTLNYIKFVTKIIYGCRPGVWATTPFSYLDLWLVIIHSYTKNQVNISKHMQKKVVTTKYLAKFQSPRAITRPKIIGPERNINWSVTYHYTPTYKYQVNISKHSEKKWSQLFYFGITDMGNTICPSHLQVQVLVVGT